ncbi:MAG: cupin domain-containing protein [Alphaproteobacteria bacterium]|nr:cupin domain-containing protein [Alphaproteobacteria bacterium]
MSADVLDTGQVENETEEMRAKREATIAASPPAHRFKLRAQLLSEGRSTDLVTSTENMRVHLKVYASGGENGLHNHTDEDHFHLVLEGSARFYGPRGEEIDCGKWEGIMLPAGSFYRFNATSEEPLVLLRVGSRAQSSSEHDRLNIYGEPLPTDAPGNGQVKGVPRPGEFWGADE